MIRKVRCEKSNCLIPTILLLLLFAFQLSSCRWRFLDLYLKSVFKDILFINSFVFWKKNEKGNKIKFWTFVELDTLEIYALWRMQYFFWYCLNATVCKFNDFSNGSLNSVQKEFVSLHKIGGKIESLLLLILMQ